MKSIRRPFEKIVEKHPDWSSLLCFKETVKNGSFGVVRTRDWFNKLVDKDDYCKSDKKILFKWLISSEVKK